jgi:ribose transport system substrate-binding protein
MDAGEDTEKVEKVGRTRITEDTTMLKKTVLFGLVISSMASVTSVAVAKELTSVGVTVGRLTNPFFVELGKGAETKVKEIAGDKATVTVVAADYDANRQFAQIDDFITSGVDLVLVNATASNAMEASLKRLRDAGIVSVAVDVAAQGTDATVTTDNVQAGQNACRFIADRLQGSGNVIIVDGPPVSAVTERIRGCKDVFTQHPDIKILSESQDGRVQSENGFDVATNLLNSFDKIDAIFTINDPEAITVDLAARQLGRKNFFITSVDASPSVVEALKRQDSLILASSAQDPYMMAQTAVEIGYEILQGRKPAQDVVLIPSELITRDNVAQYKGWTSK